MTDILLAQLADAFAGPDDVQRVPFRRGELLVREGTPWECLDVLVEGRVLLCRTAGTQMQVLALLGPGDALEIAPLVTGEATARFSYLAVTNGVRLHFPDAVARHWLQERPPFQQLAFRLLARQMELLAQRVNDLAFKDVRARLASWLLTELAANGGSSGPAVLPRYLSVRELASLLGTQREVLSRAIARLAHEGVIRVEADQIAVLDLARLRRIAEGGVQQ